MGRSIQQWLPFALPREDGAGPRGGFQGDVEVEVDAAEEVSGVPQLLRIAGARVRSRPLPAGDYLVGGRILVERKAAGDFAGSLCDGRLFRQLRYLKRSAPSSLLVVEGCPAYFERFWPPRLRSALLCVAVDFRVPTLFTRGIEGTADLLLSLGRRCLRSPGPESFAPSRARRVLTPRLRAQVDLQRTLEAVPGIGPGLALRLAAEFGTLDALRRAGTQDIARVRGIGSEKADRVRSAVQGG
ncbi:MAG: hypothetical protein A2X36_03280 [Elusimicrobia bacterium GWA2_69_24]|nr:MAG: hypothetical protein A2X36_03280 [Elusimicrobia bacterium GWA2_69_24]HBL16016.1 hypothetical protein [Elusimicrobiota bacterium]